MAPSGTFTGRIVTSTGPLVAGLLVRYFGGFTQGAAIMTGFALLSIVAMFLGRETRETPLPRRGERPLFSLGAAIALRLIGRQD
jgi:hypothetical protein